VSNQNGRLAVKLELLLKLITFLPVNATETQGQVFGCFSKRVLRLILVVSFASIEFATLAQSPIKLEKDFH